MTLDARRLACQTRLPEFAGEGQVRVRSARVIAEVGAARSAEAWALAYLAAGGVGHVVLAGDLDGTVDAAEARAHPLLHAADVGRPRGAAMVERLGAHAPGVRVSLDAGATATLPPLPEASPLVAGAHAAAQLLLRLAAP